MVVNAALLVKVGLAAVAVVFTGFAVEELFAAATFGDDLLACAAVAFGLASVILV